MIHRERRIGLVITDLDDTVYDWSSFYIPSFLAMVSELEAITGVPAETLKASFKKVHERHRTTEYAFAIQELDVLSDLNRGLSTEAILAKYRPAIVAFRRMRQASLRLFPGVRRAVRCVRDAGIPVVGLSDSMLSYVSRRLRQLNVDTEFDAVCAPEDHGVPAGVSPSVVRRAPAEKVLGRMSTIALPAALRKPSKEVIHLVCDRFGVGPAETVVVGDSLSRDVLMARRTGAVDVWARYGSLARPGLREELLKITYWTAAEVSGEADMVSELDAQRPTYTIDAFDELLPILGLKQLPPPAEQGQSE